MNCDNSTDAAINAVDDENSNTYDVYLSRFLLLFIFQHKTHIYFYTAAWRYAKWT